jgi:hypothetical protein
MSNRILCAALTGTAVTLTSIGPALSHEIVGNRVFPATLTIDDPGVNDELAFPTVSMFKTGDDPSVKQRDISGEFAKRITEDFGVSLSPTYTKLYAPGGPNMMGASGFQNLETHSNIECIKIPNTSLFYRPGLASNGVAAVPKVSAPSGLRFTHRRFGSGKVSVTCHQA